uniref:Uncharacterized protein n=1 Tax=Candidatus Kentrum sp. DK TaxID=2126562 RepID=A0A450SVX6_9GAMM|nr:MAG: hypothetical protein BECKDK2373C_GA0170839_106324 [Candidatus Kentron sp. DK]
MTGIWRDIGQGDFGFLTTLSGLIASSEERNPTLIPDLRKSPGLVVASDYGGEHRSAIWTSYSYVITDHYAVAQWVPMIQDVRNRLLPDGRRLSFKKLGDKVRMRALGPFLSAANELRGLSVTFLVHRQIPSLFHSGKFDPSNLDYEPLRSYSPHIVEKLLRVTHFFALLMAGMSAKGQDLLWVTDQDAIAPNVGGLYILTEVVGRAMSHLLDHDMRHCRVATAQSDPGDRSIEDLLALPDLVAGILPSHLVETFGVRGAPLAGFTFPRLSRMSRKQRELLDWFSDNTQPLQRLVILIDMTETGALRGTRLRYHGTRDVCRCAAW